MKYNVDGEVMLHNPGSSARGYGSAFASNWIGPYSIHAIFDKGGYKLSTIPKDGRRVGVLKILLIGLVFEDSFHKAMTNYSIRKLIRWKDCVVCLFCMNDLLCWMSCSLG